VQKKFGNALILDLAKGTALSSSFRDEMLHLQNQKSVP
jgi:hypothetical protein